MERHFKKYASAEQKLRLVHLVESDPELKSGKFSQSFPIHEANKRWLAISQELNSIPGSKKTWREWRKTWQDKKANTKKKCAFLRRQANLRSENSSSECPSLADCLIVQTIDNESLVVEGVERSKKKYASLAQKNLLQRLLEADPQLKSGKFSKSFSKSDAKKRWLVITHKLNSIPGAKKTWEEWRKTWHDKKSNAKKIAAKGSSPPESPTCEECSIFGNDDWSEEFKPTLTDSSQPGTSEQHPKLETSDPESSDARRRADAEVQLQEGLSTAEALTIRLLREKIEIKKKFYEEFIKLMTMQTRALGDIADALNNAASATDVLQ